MQELLQFLAVNYLQVIDTLLVAVLIYYILLYVRGTKTASLLAAIIIVALLYFLCQYLKLITLLFILEKVLVFGSLSLIFVFAPEIRELAERTFRRSRVLGLIFSQNKQRNTATVREEIVEAVERLVERRDGALLILEKEDSVDQHIVPGTALDAFISDTFLVSLFEKHMPLHDGAVLIREDRIHSAANFLPISENMNLPAELGTRHRAALGLTERCDAIVIIVSEERGSISIAFQGRIALDLQAFQFEAQLSALLDVNETFVSLVPRTTLI